MRLGGCIVGGVDATPPKIQKFVKTVAVALTNSAEFRRIPIDCVDQLCGPEGREQRSGKQTTLRMDANVEDGVNDESKEKHEKHEEKSEAI